MSPERDWRMRVEDILACHRTRPETTAEGLAKLLQLGTLGGLQADKS